eukprot:285682-Chlamydomonas_euryale.AAC.4
MRSKLSRRADSRRCPHSSALRRCCLRGVSGVEVLEVWVPTPVPALAVLSAAARHSRSLTSPLPLLPLAPPPRTMRAAALTGAADAYLGADIGDGADMGEGFGGTAAGAAASTHSTALFRNGFLGVRMMRARMLHWEVCRLVGEAVSSRSSGLVLDG